MGIREQIKEKPAIGYGAGAVLLLAAGLVVAKSFWPDSEADLSRAFYTVDDGKTWFADSAAKVPPFDYNGKPAVAAHVYSYANGRQQFCAYVAKFKPEAKAKLDTEIAEAAKRGKPAGSVGLLHDRLFLKSNVLVKQAGEGRPWLQYDDPKANEVFSIKSPDGSIVDSVFP